MLITFLTTENNFYVSVFQLHGEGEDYIMRSFITCTLHHILLG
jgi:hypothetical protein